jgi:hypothetical protein
LRTIPISSIQVYNIFQISQILADYGVIFWAKDPACCPGFWLKGSRFKGSEVDFTATSTNEINGKGKSSMGLTLNREP